MSSTWAKPWDHRLDVSDMFHASDKTIGEKARSIADHIKAAPFYDDADLDLVYLVEELAEVTSVDHFDEVWNAFYDWCDGGKHVWVVTR